MLLYETLKTLANAYGMQPINVQVQFVKHTLPNQFIMNDMMRP